MVNSKSSHGKILNGANETTVPQFRNSVPYMYIIPSFPVLTALMWEAKCQWVNKDGKFVTVFNGLWECNILTDPFQNWHLYGYKNAFFVEVK